MTERLGQMGRIGPSIFVFCLSVFVAFSAAAAPYAAMVIDARSGEILHSRNADTRLHPASLTKMMTLYLAFEAVERGEISLDTKVTISRKAASEPPSKLGMRAGQKIAFRYLIRAAAVKSANDAATAIAEAVEGSEAAFARRMNRTAKALGMTRTTFKNAHGLTESGHMSTARDMTTMGRRMFYDYPQYYHLFSRRTADAAGKEVANTNRRLLGSYNGADGIKTGYTRAAGFNLVASAERGKERIIATVFGGRSTATRNARVAELLDMGFRRAPTNVAVRQPAKPVYSGATASKPEVISAVTKSRRPVARPSDTPSADVIVAMQSGINETLALVDLEAKSTTPLIDLDAKTGSLTTSLLPRPRPGAAIESAAAPAPETDNGLVVVTRMSTAGGRHWRINVGKFGTRDKAERVLIQTALLELGALDDALRKVVQRSGGYEANFVGLSEDQASYACQRLVARNIDCNPFGPSG